MRKLSFLLFVLFFITTVHADVPKLLHYQGHLVDSQGLPLQGAHQVTFRIYRQDAGGVVLWSQVFSQVQMEEGNFAVLLDVGTDPSLTFNESYWLSIVVDADSEMTPRQQIASSAYAINADTVDGIQASATAAANTLLPLNAQAKFPQSVLDIQEGQGGQFDADTVDGFHASGTITPNTILPLNVNARLPQAVMPDNLDADTVDEKDSTFLQDRQHHTGIQPPATISPQGDGSTLDADKLDGQHAEEIKQEVLSNFSPSDGSFVSVTTLSGSNSGDIKISPSKIYKVIISLTHASSATTVWLRVDSDSANNYGYGRSGISNWSDTTDLAESTTATNGIKLGNMTGGETKTAYLFAELIIDTNATLDVRFKMTGHQVGGGLAPREHSVLGGEWSNLGSVVTDFEILSSNGATLTGNIYVYEYALSSHL